MGYAATVIPAGTMNWSDIQTNLDDARAWLNNVALADITDGVIRREHLVRPVILGWPQNGMDGAFQHLTTEIYGLGQPDTYLREEYGSMPERLIILPDAADGVGGLWRTPIGRPFFAPRDSYLTATLTMDFAVRGSSQAGGAFYPDGAGGPANAHEAGYFSLHLWDWAAETDTDIPSSRRYVYPLDAVVGGTFASYADDCTMLGHRHISAAGYYEVQLVYHLDDDVTYIDQIDCTKIQLVVEVF